MGWCHEFGVLVHEGCSAPMVAGATACSCPECGTECGGRFASCTNVWAAGPRLVAVRRPTVEGPAGERVAGRVTGSSVAGDLEPAPGSEVAAVPALVATAPTAAPATGDVPEVLAWMAGAVADLRSEVQQLGEGLAAHQELVERGGTSAGPDHEPLLVAELRSWVAAQAERDRLVADALAALPAQLVEELREGGAVPGRDGVARVAALADALPSRLGVAIAAAVEGRQEAYLARVEQVSAGLQAALVAVRQAVDELRGEVDRARQTTGAPGAAVDRLAGDLGARIDRLASRMEELAAHEPLAPERLG